MTGPAGPEASLDPPPHPPSPPVGFGLATATFVVVSSMIGVGILTTSGYTVAVVGSNALMLGLWAVGGLVALCGALSLAELAAMLPRSGGEYVFIHEAYGPRMAFMAGWSTVLLGFAAPVALTSRASADYLLAPLGLAGSAAEWAGLGLATACILGFAAAHATSRRRTARAQGIVTICQVAVLVAFVVAGLIAGRNGWRSLDDLPTAPEGPSAVGLLFSLLYILYAYTGWNGAAYLAGEVRDAPRRLSAAILLGLVGVTVLYLALNLVYALALPAAEVRAIARLEGSDAVKPIAERAARALFGRRWSDPFSGALGLILLATTSAYLLTGPRVVFAMAVAGHFPAVAARLRGERGTPATATAILAGLALVLLWTGSFRTLLIYSGVGLSLVSILSVGAVYALRARRPDLPRPFRVPGYPIVPGLYIGASIAVLAAAFIEEPWISALSAASLLVALPAFEVRRRRGRTAA